MRCHEDVGRGDTDGVEPIQAATGSMSANLSPRTPGISANTDTAGHERFNGPPGGSGSNRIDGAIGEVLVIESGPRGPAEWTIRQSGDRPKSRRIKGGIIRRRRLSAGNSGPHGAIPTTNPSSGGAAVRRRCDAAHPAHPRSQSTLTKPAPRGDGQYDRPALRRSPAGKHRIGQSSHQLAEFFIGKRCGHRQTNRSRFSPE